MIDEVVYMLFIIGKTLSVMEKINSWDICNKRPPRGAFIRYGAFNGEGRITQNSIRGGRLLDTGRLLEAGRLLDHLQYLMGGGSALQQSRPKPEKFKR